MRKHVQVQVYILDRYESQRFVNVDYIYQCSDMRNESQTGDVMMVTSTLRGRRVSLGYSTSAHLPSTVTPTHSNSCQKLSGLFWLKQASVSNAKDQHKHHHLVRSQDCSMLDWAC